MGGWWDFQEVKAQLNRIEWKLDAFRRQEGRFDMATQANLDRLNAAVAADTSAVSAATKALTGFVQTVSDLTAQLQAAIASGDDAAVTAAATALEANNATLIAAVPATAAAVVASTPAA
jgi:hypothetical protein